MDILFTKDECDYIKSYWSDAVVTDFSLRREKTRDDGSKFTVKLRTGNSGQSVRVFDKKFINFVQERLRKIGIQKITFESLTIIRYDEGDRLAPHIDGSHPINPDGNTIEGQELYKTLIIQISKPDEYKGGDFCLLGNPQDRTQGSYCLFQRTVEHEVREVLNGTRYSLVVYLTKEDLGEGKSIL
jgi:predicted 2-oxoglutarate/Fe(II)-dependent dioxygenase YbiX